MDKAGVIWDALGNLQNALEFLQKALEIRENFLPSNQKDLAKSYFHTSCAWDDLGNFEKSSELLDKYDALSEEGPLTPYFYDNNKYWKFLRTPHTLNDELKFWQNLLEEKRNQLSPNHPLLADYFDWMARVWDDLQRPDKKLEAYQQALNIRESVLPPVHPDLARNYYHIAISLEEQGDYQNTLKFIKKAFQIQKQYWSVSHPDQFNILAQIEDALQHAGDAFNPVAFFDSLPPPDESIWDMYDTLFAGSWYDLRHPKKSLAFRKRVLQDSNNHDAARSLELASDYNYHGCSLGKEGNYQQQLDLCQESLSIRKEFLPPGHPLILKTLENLIDACDKLGDLEQKAKYQEELDAALGDQNKSD